MNYVIYGLAIFGGLCAVAGLVLFVAFRRFNK